MRRYFPLLVLFFFVGALSAMESSKVRDEKVKYPNELWREIVVRKQSGQELYFLGRVVKDENSIESLFDKYFDEDNKRFQKAHGESVAASRKWVQIAVEMKKAILFLEDSDFNTEDLCKELRYILRAGYFKKVRKSAHPICDNIVFWRMFDIRYKSVGTEFVFAARWGLVNTMKKILSGELFEWNRSRSFDESLFAKKHIRPYLQWALREAASNNRLEALKFIVYNCESPKRACRGKYGFGEVPNYVIDKKQGVISVWKFSFFDEALNHAFIKGHLSLVEWLLKDKKAMKQISRMELNRCLRSACRGDDLAAQGVFLTYAKYSKELLAELNLVV